MIWWIPLALAAANGGRHAAKGDDSKEIFKGAALGAAAGMGIGSMVGGGAAAGSAAAGQAGATGAGATSAGTAVGATSAANAAAGAGATAGGASTAAGATGAATSASTAAGAAAPSASSGALNAMSNAAKAGSTAAKAPAVTAPTAKTFGAGLQDMVSGAGKQAAIGTAMQQLQPEVKVTQVGQMPQANPAGQGLTWGKLTPQQLQELGLA